MLNPLTDAVFGTAANQLLISVNTGKTAPLIGAFPSKAKKATSRSIVVSEFLALKVKYIAYTMSHQMSE